MFMTHLWQFL